MKNKIILIGFTIAAIVIGVFVARLNMLSSDTSSATNDNKITTSLDADAKKSKTTAAQMGNLEEFNHSEEKRFSASAANQEALLIDELMDLFHCKQNNNCPQDNSDPRASSILLGKKLSEKLKQYTDFHLQHDFFDQQSIDLTKQFLVHSDGYVQQEAINLMSAQEPNLELASLLITELENSFDAKIIHQSLKELQRYPELSSDIQQLFSSVLTTGSFYAGEELATNILPFLNSSNVNHFIAVADSLPQNSAKVRALRSNIEEFLLRQSKG